MDGAGTEPVKHSQRKACWDVRSRVTPPPSDEPLLGQEARCKSATGRDTRGENEMPTVHRGQRQPLVLA